MSKRSGLFGHRPDLLLVDERAPSIDLAAVAPTRLPRLQDEPPDAPPPLSDPDEPGGDDDSYDGGGPLRIFIGGPRVEGAAPAVPAVTGPVWDASALAASMDEEFDTDADLEPVAPRAPVLMKPSDGGLHPPPLTMSFGGSFTRGSLDAGVMDEDSASASSPVLRADTVVVHDQIFDRFLRFEDPLDTPPVRGPANRMDDEPEEPLSVGAFDEDEVLEAMESGAAGDVEEGPPPTRGLTVGFLPGRAPSDDEDESDLVDDLQDPDDETGDDDLDGPGVPRVVIGDQAPPTRVGSSPPPLSLSPTPLSLSPTPLSPTPLSLPTMDAPTAPTTRITPAASPVDPRSLLRDAPPAPALDEDTELDLGQPVPEEAPTRLAPDWASRRSEAGRRAVALPEPPGPQAEDDGGRLGLIAFALLAVIAVLVTWLLLREGNRPPAEPVPTDVPTEQAPDRVPAPAGGDAPPASDVVAPVTAEPSVPSAPAAEVSPTEGVEVGPSIPATESAGEDEGVLRVRATRPSRVYIDGAYVGQTPLPALALSAGSHDVRVVAVDSGRSRSQSVRVDAGRSQEVRFSY